MDGSCALVELSQDENPRAVLLDLMQKNPSLNKADLFDLFRKRLLPSQTLMRAVMWYFFINMFEYENTTRHHPDRNRGPSGRSLSGSARLQRRTEIDEIALNIKTQLSLLDLVMPNEKLMRNCTGAEMAKFGNRYMRIAERVGKQKTVGEVLNDDQVKEILK